MSVVGALVKRREMSSRWTQRHLEISLLGRALARFEYFAGEHVMVFLLATKVEEISG